MNPVSLIQAVFFAGLAAIIGMVAWQKVSSQAGKAIRSI